MIRNGELESGPREFRHKGRRYEGRYECVDYEVTTHPLVIPHGWMASPTRWT